MQFSVYRTISLNLIDPSLPEEEERVEVSGAASFEEATQTLDRCVADRKALWKDAVEQKKASEQALVPPTADPAATEVLSAAHVNPVQGQAAVQPAPVTTPEQPADVKPVDVPPTAPIAQEAAPAAPAEAPVATAAPVSAPVAGTIPVSTPSA